ncbi:MAG: hypothetical protein IKB04_04165 [Clostridia bacterium]|nr:hypothetical protein [Clostridia bacterium]
MLRPHPRYQCFPSVICVGRETEITIVPRDISRVFREENDYEFGIFGLRDDLVDYHFSPTLDRPFHLVDGCLRFTFTAESEQEFSVRFRVNGGKEERLALYALHEDLYQLRPLKGDFHSHTYYSDGQDGVAMTPAEYREEGFDFFALTDHNRLFTSELAADLYKDIPLGMHIMTGEEVHPPESSLHIVGVGQTTGVSYEYIHHKEAYEAALDELESTLTHVPEQYRRRTAMAKWCCNEIRKNGGLAIFAHPFWCPNLYNYSEEFLNILFDEKLFDAVEIVGGIGTNGRLNNLQLTTWQEQAFKGNVLPVVGSSDSHNHYSPNGKFGRCFSVVFAKENTTASILEAVRSGYSVAGEVPRGDDADIRFYGSQFRLVAFAHFLYEHYFSETRRLCFGEGTLMQRYAEGEPVGELLAAFASTVSDFYKKFYGLLPAPTLPAERLAFLDRCRERQRTEGPATKGSKLYLYDNNTNVRRE